MMPPQGYIANQLIGPIYAPDGTILYDPRSDGALTYASQLTAYPAILGTDVSSNVQTATGISGSNSTVATTASLGGGVSLAAKSAQMLVLGWGLATNNTTGDGLLIYLFRSTTGIPTSGSAPATGDVQLASYIQQYPASASTYQSATMVALDTGLTVGTTYYYYLALTPLLGGEALVDTGSVVAFSL